MIQQQAPSTEVVLGRWTKNVKTLMMPTSMILNLAMQARNKPDSTNISTKILDR
jgi:hypothetical protein